LIIFTLYENFIPVENLVIDFQRCYLHVKTNHPTTYSKPDFDGFYEYKAVLKTTNVEDVDIMQVFRIQLVPNPNHYKTSLMNRKIYDPKIEQEEWTFEYYYHFDRKGHSLAI
jgi:hypothetical protein